MTAFVDTDIILDLLAKREPFYGPAAVLFSRIDCGEIRGLASSLCFSNIFYVLRKYGTRRMALSSLQKVESLVEILPVGSDTIKLALSSEFQDFEDAIQYYTAIGAGAEFIITRNVRDFKKGRIPVCTADEFLRIYASQQSQ